ncbi:hypothetical protein ACFY93_26345 [Streptomyces sp. NPDC008313]|uniref:hypothetical protein n=1 Tax=Streptomyces sp. NPDC008313 TaxID=3364826 RepID=UPI0036E91219
MIEKLLLSPLRTRPWPERWLTRLLGAALSTAAYLLCLPWDLRSRVADPGTDIETTPVTVTGVVLLAVALLTLGAYFGLRDALAWPLLLVAVPPATLMHVSFRTHPEPDATLWPLAWAVWTLAIGVAVLVAAGVARQFRTWEGERADEDDGAFTTPSPLRRALSAPGSSRRSTARPSR